MKFVPLAAFEVLKTKYNELLHDHREACRVFERQRVDYKRLYDYMQDYRQRDFLVR